MTTDRQFGYLAADSGGHRPTTRVEATWPAGHPPRVELADRDGTASAVGSAWT
jgi:hypothetical protein